MQPPLRPKILLVDDNPRVRSFVRPALEDSGFDCIEAEDGYFALEMVDTESPDLIVLDIMLGDDSFNGLDVCKKIRERGLLTPVLFLTIKDRTEDPRYMEQAFRLGGDDYISKRVELRRIEQRMGLDPSDVLERKSDTEELIARIRARLPHADPLQEFDDYLRVNIEQQQVHVKREDLWMEEHLAPKELSILRVLINSGGRPVGKNQLMDAAEVDGEGSLQNHIWKLRQKLEIDPQHPRYILTYHKIGYRFRSVD